MIYKPNKTSFPHQSMIFRRSFLIDSKAKLSEAVDKFKLLPFFPNNIRGLSVEEMCAPGMLFGGNYDEGCWEWKGPVIREGKAAYGKFFKKKAGFVSLDLLPDFLSYRRKAYPVKPGSTEEMLLEIIKVNDSMTSTELKEAVFGGRKRERWDELPETGSLQPEQKGRKSLEGPLQRLQMGGWLLISDFQYKKTKSGERYGWGVARYSTPESVFGEDIVLKENLSKEDALDTLVSKAKKNWSPLVGRSSWIKLLK